MTAFEYAERHFGVDSAYLVFEDRSNPAVDSVEKALTDRNVPCTLQSEDLIADLQCLLGAHHIVRSYGTSVKRLRFSQSIAKLFRIRPLLYAA